MKTSTSVPALVIRRTFDAPVERVYEAWTDPSLAGRFLSPRNSEVLRVDMDVRPGGAYRVVLLHEDGDEWGVGGVYREVVPPRRLSMTWAWEEDDPKDAHESLLTIELADLRGKTELTLTHEYLASPESRERHSTGWAMVLDKLAEVLA